LLVSAALCGVAWRVLRCAAGKSYAPPLRSLLVRLLSARLLTYARTIPVYVVLPIR
jgi:hypothetical protein